MAFASQWTLTKRDADTTAALGSQNSSTGDFYCWKSRASICIHLLERRSCFLQFSKHALTSPQQFYPGTSERVQAHRTFTSFSDALKFPDFITHNPLWQPGHGTGSWEAPLLTTAWGQPAAWEITTNILIYSNKICKQPHTCVSIEHTYLLWNLGAEIEEVFTATATNFS